MNPISISKLFGPKGEVQAPVQQGISTLIISSVIFSLVALTGYVRMVQASGPESGGQASIEMLRNIDPADRKFFTPGHGTQIVMSGEANVLPAIDPADRKFFNPGYGTQYINDVKDQAALPTTVNEMGNQIPIWFLLK